MTDVVALLEEFERWKSEQDYPDGSEAERFAQHREDEWNLTKLQAVEALVFQHGWDIQAFETIIESRYGDSYVLSLIDDAEETEQYLDHGPNVLVSDKTIEYVLDAPL